MRTLIPTISVVLVLLFASVVEAGGTDLINPTTVATSEGRRIEVAISAGGSVSVVLGDNPLASCVFVADLDGPAVIDYAGGLGIELGITNPEMETAVGADGNPQGYVFVSCREPVFSGFGWAVWTVGDPVPDEVLEALGDAAVAAIELDVPTPQTAPDGLAIPFLTQLPVWLWVPPETWTAASATAALPDLGVSVTATATPTLTRWDTGAGDDRIIECDAGIPWSPELDDDQTSCLVTYTSTTPPGSTLDLAVATTYDVSIVCSFGPCPPGVDLQPVTVAASRPITVTEARGVITR